MKYTLTRLCRESLFAPYLCLRLGGKKGQHKVLKVDLVDVVVRTKRWHVVAPKSGGFYAAQSSGAYLHRILTGCPKDMVVDHINHDTLDNRRQNLRVTTRANNNKNIQGRKKGKSKYKGVYWDKRTKRWMSRIGCNYKYTFLGRYDTEEEAAKAYDEAAKAKHGEFACLNFPI